ncbi:ABC transporter permease [Chachezhania sediminis]|uniref:ABC transporter permease n=1 Tax=Chachezhania sediminis TaxID=2599291 RepID=UPI001E42DE72|nr:ABC transporter permease [Chachezhania sediminis]
MRRVAGGTSGGGGHGTAVRAIVALMLREMSTRYGRTPGGYLWAVLEPLAAILVLSLGFSLLLRSPPLGTSFILFYATGYTPFNLYQSLSNSVARSLNFSRALLRYPAVTWVDSVLARFLLNTLTGILVSFLLLGGILATLDTRVVIDPVPVIEAMGLSMLLGLGVGVLNCALMGLFPIWEVAWSVITRPLFIASGILFLYDSLPAGAQAILWYNPLMHIVGLMHSGFYPIYTPSYVSFAYVIFCALATLSTGVLLMGRYHRDILNQ